MSSRSNPALGAGFFRARSDPLAPFVRLFVRECDGYCPIFELDLISLDSYPIAGVRGG
jgi:hypothetical protein